MRCASRMRIRSCTICSCVSESVGLPASSSSIFAWGSVTVPVAPSSSFTPLRPGIEQLAIAANLGEAAHDPGEDRVGLGFGNTLLPHENLPQADQRLEGAGEIGAQRRILHLC